MVKDMKVNESTFKKDELDSGEKDVGGNRTSVTETHSQPTSALARRDT